MPDNPNTNQPNTPGGTTGTTGSTGSIGSTGSNIGTPGTTGSMGTTGTGGTGTGAAPALSQTAQQYGQKISEVATQAKDYVADKVSVVGDKIKDLQNADLGEIAELLTIRTNTADRHLSNILSKTGSSNRADAAVYAARHSLVG